MNRVEAKRIFSSILQLLKNEDPTNFERDHSESLISHINSDKLNLQDWRLRIALFVEKFEIIDLVIKNFIYEDEKAGIQFYMKVKTKDHGEIMEDHLFYIYHFEKNQVKESWVLTKLPIDQKSLRV